MRDRAFAILEHFYRPLNLGCWHLCFTNLLLFFLLFFFLFILLLTTTCLVVVKHHLIDFVDSALHVVRDFGVGREYVILPILHVVTFVRHGEVALVVEKHGQALLLDLGFIHSVLVYMALGKV